MGLIEQCKLWVEKVVIKHDFCPFAKHENDLGRVDYVLSESVKVEDGLQLFIKQCERLDEDAGVGTILIVYPNLSNSFDDFLDFVDMANKLLVLQGYESVYQLASFHPDYCFEGDDENDASNYTNRSPYPMLHLLREESLERAVESYPHPESIPENNIQLAREKGSDYFQQILNEIKKDKES